MFKITWNLTVTEQVLLWPLVMWTPRVLSVVEANLYTAITIITLELIIYKLEISKLEYSLSPAIC